MNDQLTIKELLKYCKYEISIGNGNKHIVISNDNEGNGYHGLFFAFTKIDEETKKLIYDSQFNDEKDTIILG